MNYSAYGTVKPILVDCNKSLSVNGQPCLAKLIS